MAATRAEYDRGDVDVRESLWARDAPALDLPALEGGRRADVCVIGAGLAGSTLALHLAERGVDTALVEAREPGWGASGRNAGQAVPFRDLDRALGGLPDRGEALLDLWRRSQGIPFELAAKHDIEFGASQGGYLQVAHKPGLVPTAERKARRWQDRGFDVRFTDAGETARLTGASGFRGGVLAERGGRMNPYLLTRGLVEAARRSGARVFARSPVTDVRTSGDRLRVITDQGAIEAERVVACTNGYTGAYSAALAEAWCPLVAFVIASKPLPRELAEGVLPNGIAVGQMPAGFHPSLVDADRRVVTSLLPGPLRPQDTRSPLAWMQRWMHRHFAATRDVEFELDAYWTGRMAYSVDDLPRIYQLAPGFLALMCFSGEGNVPAPMLGRHLAECLDAGRLGDLVLPVQTPERIRWRDRYHVALRCLGVPALRLAERLGLF